MTPWIDIGILTVVGLSVLLSLFSGFVREAISLVALVVAAWVAFNYSTEVSVYFPEFLHSVSFPVAGKAYTVQNMHVWLAAICLVLGVLLLGSILSFIAGKLIRLAALGGVDRLLGVLFGVMRGVAIVVLLVLIAGLTSFPQSELWKQSRMVGPFQAGAALVVTKMPQEYAKFFSYEPAPPVIVPAPSPSGNKAPAPQTPANPAKG